ncbi:MAG: amino acid ABC transporter permease [Chloroflexi bacterium]|nr:amino acid ABC transporter permease [Chloroflexota bacterium]
MTVAGFQIPDRRVAWRWARENLFDGSWNTALTVGMVVLIGVALYGVGNFVFASAEWEAITANRKLFFIGAYPRDEAWRIWAVIYVLAGLGGLSWALWSRISPLLAIGGAIAMIPVFVFMAHGEVALLTLGSLAAFGGGYAFGKTPALSGRYRNTARTVAVFLWIASLPFSWVLLDGVPTRLWGGLLLTMVLTVFGITIAFPFGVLLALGRASTFPVIRLFCVGFIEIVRGVPLITILFMAFFLLPLAIGPERTILFGIPVTGVDTATVQRALAGIVIFAAAYLAEIVRGGLQAVPRGQTEAAKALGLNTFHILGFIVLPQALRAVIPALVGQFISLFKDTSLVLVLALTDLLGAARQVSAQPDFIGRQAETLLFIALIYWIVAFNMSRASQQIEKNLGVGER